MQAEEKYTGRIVTYLPEQMKGRYVERAARTRVSLTAYLRIVLSRADREMIEEESRDPAH